MADQFAGPRGQPTATRTAHTPPPRAVSGFDYDCTGFCRVCPFPGFRCRALPGDAAGEDAEAEETPTRCQLFGRPSDR